MDLIEMMLRLGAALGIGLLVGVERGQRSAEAPEGSRVAGVRTFALSGLLGGTCGLLAVGFFGLNAPVAAAAVLAAGLLAHAAPHIAFRLAAAAHSRDFGVTTILASQTVFVLGATALLADARIAAAGGAATAIVLRLKAPAHRFVAALSEREVNAALRFLALAAIGLPLLPNSRLGPFGAINPFEFGLIVVLISGVSFLGYLALRLFGGRSGAMIAGGVGGFVSSTAVTLAFARRAREAPEQSANYSAGVFLAGAAMWARMAAIAAVAAPSLAERLIPLAAPALVLLAAALGPILKRKEQGGGDGAVDPGYPFDLKLAVKFAALLTAVAVAVEALKPSLSAWGLYALAFLAGVADVDAGTLAFSRAIAGPDAIAPGVATIAILIVGLSDTLTKTMIALIVGAGAGVRMALPLAASAAAALAAALLMLQTPP